MYGRYNKRKSPSENINLPAALLSRFDLMFLILDKADIDADTALARHITYVHANNRHPELDFTPLKSSFIRAYISQARQLDPYVPEGLTNFIVQSYVDMRARDADSARDAGVQSVMTARQLLSILRLSQALARLRFSRRVELEDVEESIRLVHMCKASLLEDDTFTGEDPTTRIYSLIRDHATARGQTTVNYAAVERTLLTKGFTQEQISGVWRSMRNRGGRSTRAGRRLHLSMPCRSKGKGSECWCALMCDVLRGGMRCDARARVLYAW